MSASRKLVLACELDRERLEKSCIGHLVLFTETGTALRPLLRNSFPLIAIAFSDEAETSLKATLSSLQSLAALPEISLCRLPADSNPRELEMVRVLLEGGLGRLASYSAAVLSELVLLRRERETLLENYRSLEDAFQARNWEPLTETFAHDPYVDPKDEGIGALLANGHVEQLLPVSSHGVAGFALHFHSVPRRGGEVSVTLDYVESEERVGEWRADYAHLVADWNFFSLPRACGGGAKTMRIRVSTNGPETAGLSLGYPIASERYASRSDIEHADLDLRPIAFKVFTGVPGIAPVHVPNMIAPSSVSQEPRVLDYHLPVDLLRQVIDVSVSSVVPEFETISFLEHEHALVCHPLPSGITAGAISRAVEAGTTSVSASAIIDHPEGAPAAVSFLLAPSSANPRSKVAEIDWDDLVGPTPFFSGWREVGPHTPISINMHLDEPLADPMDLMILSRAIGDSVDFSWLKVSGFRVVKQPMPAHADGGAHVR